MYRAYGGGRGIGRRAMRLQTSRLPTELQNPPNILHLFASKPSPAEERERTYDESTSFWLATHWFSSTPFSSYSSGFRYVSTFAPVFEPLAPPCLHKLTLFYLGTRFRPATIFDASHHHKRKGVFFSSKWLFY